MDNSESLDVEINSLCRTCLEQLMETNKYDIFLMPSLAKWLSVCTSLMIEENDGYPKHLCNNCYTKIQDFYEFREMCVKSVQKFEEIKCNLQNSKDQYEDKAEEGNSDQLKEKNIKCEVNEKNTENVNDDDSESDEFESNRNETRVSTTIANKRNLKNENTAKKRRKPEREKESNSTKSKGVYSRREVFVCDACDKRFFHKDKYEAHKRIHLGLKPWECTLCQKQYIKYTSLKAHLLEHVELTDVHEIFPCTFEGCDKTFKLKHKLREHIRRVHLKIVKPRKLKSYICEQCGKSMMSLTGLYSHRLIHSDELPFKCDVCSKAFKSKSVLRVHMRRHNDNTNFICSICGLKRISQHELKLHMNYHTKERQAKCKFCEYTSPNTGTVRRHERTVHYGIKAFTCKFCGHNFAKAETLKYHVMTHTGEKPYQCNLCGRRFIQSVALKTHMKRHGKENPESSKRHQGESQQQDQQTPNLAASSNCNDIQQTTDKI